VTREDALAAIWAELRRLAHLIADLADRVTWLEDHNGDNTNHDPPDNPEDHHGREED